MFFDKKLIKYEMIGYFSGASFGFGILLLTCGVPVGAFSALTYLVSSFTCGIAGALVGRNIAYTEIIEDINLI